MEPIVATTQIPKDNIFSINHLNYVMSSPETLIAYLSEAIGIDNSFLIRFQPHHWASALEQTLLSKPENVPTEVYLKSQRLWIMHKLLVNVPGLKDRISALLQTLQKYDPSEDDILRIRQQLSTYFKELSIKVTQSHVPSLVIIDDCDMLMRNFVKTYNSTLIREQRTYMDRRCQIIRWFAWVYTENGPGLLQNGSMEHLLQMFLQWSFTQPSPSPLVPTKAETITVTPPEPFQPARSPLKVDAPSFFPRSKK